jgi:hypothetical protein
MNPFSGKQENPPLINAARYPFKITACHPNPAEAGKIPALSFRFRPRA